MSGLAMVHVGQGWSALVEVGSTRVSATLVELNCQPSSTLSGPSSVQQHRGKVEKRAQIDPHDHCVCVRPVTKCIIDRGLSTMESGMKMPRIGLRYTFQTARSAKTRSSRKNSEGLTYTFRTSKDRTRASSDFTRLLTSDLSANPAKPGLSGQKQRIGFETTVMTVIDFRASLRGTVARWGDIGVLATRGRNGMADWRSSGQPLGGCRGERGDWPRRIRLTRIVISPVTRP